MLCQYQLLIQLEFENCWWILLLWLLPIVLIINVVRIFLRGPLTIKGCLPLVVIMHRSYFCRKFVTESEVFFDFLVVVPLSESIGHLAADLLVIEIAILATGQKLHGVILCSGAHWLFELDLVLGLSVNLMKNIMLLNVAIADGRVWCQVEIWLVDLTILQVSRIVEIYRNIRFNRLHAMPLTLVFFTLFFFFGFFLIEFHSP